jgi:hypothetical protein
MLAPNCGFHSSFQEVADLVLIHVWLTLAVHLRHARANDSTEREGHA